jgi:putative selenate reductase
MSDVMRVQPFAVQLQRLQLEYERERAIFGIPAALFHVPAPNAPYAVPDLFGRPLATPVGPSAGPHTQLSQNIVSAWLCGGRFIELKTVQVNDRLVIPRPSIDMTDEGYNVEWSQELSLDQSAHEYVAAWALVHLLPRILGWDRGPAPVAVRPGAVFDLSVGYDLQGIRHPRLTRFLDLMADASELLGPISVAIARHCPQAADVEIPARVATSVTLSTMHGCPPGEIERIARYLLEERRLHTVIKLNPTLLGRDGVREILHDRLGFTNLDLPESAFEHDLTYPRAVALITALSDTARTRGLGFGVKLSNTLAVRPRDRRLPGDEQYLSGRALYPVTMALFDRLLHEFDGSLPVSYSGGADALNVSTILACGALPVTGCTDLLKPGGYARLGQWIGRLHEAMARQGARSLAEFSRDRLARVRRAAGGGRANPR